MLWRWGDHNRCVHLLSWCDIPWLCGQCPLVTQRQNGSSSRGASGRSSRKKTSHHDDCIMFDLLPLVPCLSMTVYVPGRIPCECIIRAWQPRSSNDSKIHTLVELILGDLGQIPHCAVFNHAWCPLKVWTTGFQLTVFRVDRERINVTGGILPRA